jgi:hypothetical protein
LADAFLPVFFPEDFLVDFLAFLVVFFAAIASFPQPFVTLDRLRCAGR